MCGFDSDSDSGSKKINRILQPLHAEILKFAEEKSYFETGKIESGESYFEVERVRSKQGREPEGKMKVFDMKKCGDKVYTRTVNNCSAAEFVSIIKKLALCDSLRLIHSGKHNQRVLSADI